MLNLRFEHGIISYKAERFLRFALFFCLCSVKLTKNLQFYQSETDKWKVLEAFEHIHFNKLKCQYQMQKNNRKLLSFFSVLDFTKD